jgi:hypothetical protein
MTDGVERHPLAGPFQRSLERALAETGGEPQIRFMLFSPSDVDTPVGSEVIRFSPPDVDSLFGFLNVRRDQLLAILRKSIELNEPLYCEL